MIPGDSPSRYPPMKGSYSFSHSSDARNSQWIVSEHGCSRSAPAELSDLAQVPDPSQVWRNALFDYGFFKHSRRARRGLALQAGRSVHGHAVNRSPPIGGEHGPWSGREDRAPAQA